MNRTRFLFLFQHHVHTHWSTCPQVAAPHPALGAAFERAARLLLPQGVRDSAYDTVAENRYSILGKRDTCRLPDPGDDRFLA